MDFIKNGMKNLESIGFGAAVPGLRDSVKNIVNNVTTSDDEQKAKMQAVIDADRAEQRKLRQGQPRSQGRNMRQNTTSDAGGYKGYKTGGKVSSASKRADGCCVKGKTKGRMV
jgi:hypothetical protein